MVHARMLSLPLCQFYCFALVSDNSFAWQDIFPLAHFKKLIVASRYVIGLRYVPVIMAIPFLSTNVPQPVCAALDVMENPPRWQTCFSDINLDSFANYMAHYATLAEAEELLNLPVVYHRGSWDLFATRIPIGVMVRQLWIALPEAECTATECAHCEEGRGGYSFHWVDKRWTPEAAVDLTQTLQAANDQSRMPWPRGTLCEPQPVPPHVGSRLDTESDMPYKLWGQ